MNVSDVLRELNTLAPFSSALEWDNVGLLVGDEKAPVSRIYVALDATDNVIRRALEQDADLLITHHPMMLSPIRRVCESDMIGRRVLKMAKHHLNYIAMHTNFDVHIMGSLVADKLSLQNRDVLEVTEDGLQGKKGIGVIGTIPPISTGEYAKQVKELFQLPHVAVFGDDQKMLQRIAVCPGAGKSVIDEAIKKKADILLTGDIGHHSGIDAVAQGLSIMDAGHYGLEHVFVSYMQVWLHQLYQDLPIMGEEIRFPIRVY